MPMIDMPLEELKTYYGSSPCPDNIDEYWNKAIEEMKNTDSDVSITPSEYQTLNTECFDLYFTGVGGSRVYAKYLRPKNITSKIPCVLMFHGYSGGSAEWFGKLGFVNMGYAVLALDTRGQGGQSEDITPVRGTTLRGHIIRGLGDTPENLYFRRAFLDTAQLANIAMELDEIDETRIAAMGVSQGGALTIACAALEPKVKLALPTYPFLSDYKRVWQMDLAKDAYSEIKEYFTRFDPRHEREDEMFYKLGYIDIQNIAKRVKAKVFWTIGLMDTVCPPSTQFAVYNKINSDKEMVIYPDFGHEGIADVGDANMKFLMENL